MYLRYMFSKAQQKLFISSEGSFSSN